MTMRPTITEVVDATDEIRESMEWMICNNLHGLGEDCPMRPCEGIEACAAEHNLSEQMKKAVELYAGLQAGRIQCYRRKD
jgi:hypothetical protein